MKQLGGALPLLSGTWRETSSTDICLFFVTISKLKLLRLALTFSIDEKVSKKSRAV